MEIDNRELDKSYLRAKKRVEKLKKYYSHVSIYLMLNIVLSSYKVYKDLVRGDSFEEAIFEGDNFFSLVLVGYCYRFSHLQYFFRKPTFYE